MRLNELPPKTLIKQAHAGVKLIADQYPEAAAILREAITRFDVLREVHQLAKQEAQPVIPRWPSDEVERDALRYRFLRDKDFFGDEDEQGLVGWEGLVELSYNEFDAAVDARISHPNIDYVKLDTALRKHIPAQPVSEPYKLPSGYALVPVEPTAGMKNVGISEAMKLNANVRMVYQAMLAAAPAQEGE